MINDPRIEAYREAALARLRGRFDVRVPIEPDDSIGRLGRALDDLGKTLSTRFSELGRLLEITERINAGLMLDDVLNYLYDSFRTLIPYQRNRPGPDRRRRPRTFAPAGRGRITPKKRCRSDTGRPWPAAA